jgi:hypothetical protein
MVDRRTAMLLASASLALAAADRRAMTKRTAP